MRLPTLTEAHAELVRLLRERAFLRGDFVLTSGRRSSWYFNGKLVTLDARGAALTGMLVAHCCRAHGCEAVGGLSMGADPVASAAAAYAGWQGWELGAFLVRKEKKEHGAQDRIAMAAAADGRPLLGPGRRVALVEDAVTTGGSILQALDAVRAAGADATLAVTLVDRLQGGSDRLRAEGLTVVALAAADDEGNLTALPLPAAVLASAARPA